MNLKYASILELDTQRYPGKVASTVFLGGCTMKCPWCNTPFLLSQETSAEAPAEYFVEKFSKQKEFVDAVVFTGGEPLMQGNALLELCKELDKQGFLVKIETNGYYPEGLNDLLPFIDYVAMDLKARLKEKDYAEATGFSGDPELLLSNVLRTLAFLEKAKQPVFKEFRTTVVPGLNDDPSTIKELSAYVKNFCDLYALQAFSPDGSLVDAAFKEKPLVKKETLLKLGLEAKKSVPAVVLRFNGEEETV